MKKFMYIGITISLIIISFFLGIEKSPAYKQVNGVLAYEHYYESAESIFTDLNLDSVSKDKVNELIKSKEELDSINRNFVLQWPIIVDQRDQLSDIIRSTMDHHPEIRDEIISSLKVYYEDPNIIQNWSYSY